MSHRTKPTTLTFLLLLSAAALPGRLLAGPPAGGVEGVHGAVPGFPVNSCYVCHDIVPGTTGRDAVQRPNETCFGCHTEGPTYGEGDPWIDDRPHATPVGNHANLITGSSRFTYGDFGLTWPYAGYEQQIDCTTCHDPHRTFDPADPSPSPSTTNVKYIRDHTDDFQVGFTGQVLYFPSKTIKVIDNTEATPVTMTKVVDQDIVYTGTTNFADGIGQSAAEADVCEVCHTLTSHHQVDGTAPGGQSHFDGENCTSCHTHQDGFAPSGGAPLTGPHALFGDPDCGVCHDSPDFPGAVNNPAGLPSLFCQTCHGPSSSLYSEIHTHLVTGSGKFEYNVECTTCHDQHGWNVTNIEGDDNLKYIKAGFSTSLTVVDNTGQSGPVGTEITKSVAGDLIFTGNTGPGSFADGDFNYTEDVCNTCHTLTSHHQNDGDAPGGQSHNDGQDCTSCHTHVDGFAPSGGAANLDGPHLTVSGGDCGICHNQVAGGFEGALDNSDLICMSCHGAAPTVIDATDAHTHSDGVTGTVKFGYAANCASCHNPHEQFQQAGGKYIRAVIEDLVWNPATGSADPVPLELTVVDKTGQSGPVPTTITKTIQAPFFYTGSTSLGSGGGGSLCETCHSLTEHHQNDGTAPGGQSHFDGQDCTQCHLHVEGFGPDATSFGLEGPHAAMPVAGVPANDCGVCHNQVLGGVAGALADPNTICLSCHGDNPAVYDATDAHTHSTAVTGSSRFDYANNCTNCHNPHKQSQPGGKYIRSRIEDLMLDPVLGAVAVPLELTVTDNTGQSSPATFTKQILSVISYDGATTLGDGSGAGLCETCHTVTNHHQSDGTAPGGQDHFNGAACTGCHAHVEGFTPSGIEDHPQAQTECSNCHLNQSTGEQDLLGQHDNNCELCHTIGFDSTLLGPLGTFAGECTECHNPNVNETGNMDVPTKRHRCVVCHGEQETSGDFEKIHKEHIDKANCVTCHGFIPDVGVQIGSGNRQICRICHEGGKSGDIEKIHEKHTKEGLSCLECHGGERPPVDVVFGGPVGGANVVCEICHEYETDNLEDIHKKHSDMRLDCGSCHRNANLQDDRVPMPPIDDPVRAMLDRQGSGECAHCHEGGKRAGAEKAHKKHVADQWQWCYNCHLPDDPRPAGNAPPATEPAKACVLCHNSKAYDDSFPFDIHERHADKNKCYACNQTQPLFSDWPNEWLGGR